MKRAKYVKDYRICVLLEVFGGRRKWTGVITQLFIGGCSLEEK